MAAVVAVPSLTYEGVPLDDELGGGLNNLIMNLAQILHDACSRHAVLVLPHITSGWRFFPASNHSRQTLEFSDVFDSSYFIEQVQPCVAVATAPPGAVFRRSKVVGINNRWPYDHALPRVYKALRPSARMRGVVDQLVASASKLAGPSWSGVHLRIERDWWEVSPFCNRKRYPTQRCFIPSEVAALIDAHRHRLRSSGSVLFYASENIPRRGPRVNFSPFGPRTAKVQIPTGLPYTLRATAEFFLAARSPAGFYGNSFSTFSRGVALLRRMQGGTDTSSHGQRSFAYDCGAALRETPSSAGGIRYLDTLNR
ncbi:hypothetical protein AB1Y20_012487 [Prymnesium parvum]|uniref:O-fucosyltransferase family protein n=1 Tax=Prymnesium parvum TaxID=97485 RepID=A0AB34IKZ3_PRYPA